MRKKKDSNGCGEVRGEGGMEKATDEEKGVQERERETQ